MPRKGSAEVQRQGSGNSSSRFSSWSASPWSSAWSTIRGGAIQCKGPLDEIGGGNGSSRRVRPYVRRVASAGPSASRRRQDRVVEEVSLTSAQAKLQFEEHGLADASFFLRSTNRPCRFRAGVGRVACLCPAVAAGKHRSPFSIAIRRSRLRRTGKETSEKFVKLDVAPLHRNHGRAEVCTVQSALVSRIVRVVCPNGDTDRQRRGQCAGLFAGARCGLRGVRVGEATHPGPDESPHSESSDIAVSNPAPRLPATQVDCDDELLLSQLANELANVPGPEVHVLSQGSSSSDWTTRSAKASAPQVEFIRKRTCSTAPGSSRRRCVHSRLGSARRGGSTEGEVPRVIRQVVVCRRS